SGGRTYTEKFGENRISPLPRRRSASCGRSAGRDGSSAVNLTRMPVTLVAARRCGHSSAGSHHLQDQSSPRPEVLARFCSRSAAHEQSRCIGAPSRFTVPNHSPGYQHHSHQGSNVLCSPARGIVEAWLRSAREGTCSPQTYVTF